MLRLERQDDFVEIDLASQETDDMPSRGDADITIHVSAAEFTGQQFMGAATALRSFLRPCPVRPGFSR
jgi:hypothetical protein